MRSFTLTSPAFKSYTEMPVYTTCESAYGSEGIFPGVEWFNPPAGTLSYVLIVEDPDAPDPAAPQRIWDHLVMYDIPGNLTRLVRGFQFLENSIKFGVNSSGIAGYSGPCPPIGKHRYFFRLFALNVPTIGLPAGATKKQVIANMQNNILGEADLVGFYAKKGRGTIL